MIPVNLGVDVSDYCSTHTVPSSEWEAPTRRRTRANQPTPCSKKRLFYYDRCVIIIPSKLAHTDVQTIETKEVKEGISKKGNKKNKTVNQKGVDVEGCYPPTDKVWDHRGTYGVPAEEYSPNDLEGGPKLIPTDRGQLRSNGTPDSSSPHAH